MDGLTAALAAILPSIGVGLIFWFAIRALVNADRTERQALARMDAEERRAAQQEAVTTNEESKRDRLTSE
ncbi:hypothetical protein ACFO3K_12385 [Cellulomonas algicola]|uniref:Uncharacterized protein n=1 Tax=Cellulomonas algicola TaxID=2071633 RepID=A0A401V1A4_9CELL|nr:hypothetical protein [Cellulomonas algicola]GCD20690.1 hypothetical protein CTKZ_22520 [Cellulomonas algicola]